MTNYEPENDVTIETKVYFSFIFRVIVRILSENDYVIIF